MQTDFTGPYFTVLRWHNEPGKPFSIFKDYDDGRIWNAPGCEVVGYFKNRANAKRARDIVKRMHP